MHEKHYTTCQNLSLNHKSISFQDNAFQSWHNDKIFDWIYMRIFPDSFFVFISELF